MELEVSVVNGGLLFRPQKEGRSLEELVGRITPENLHGKTEWGPPLGREVW